MRFEPSDLAVLWPDGDPKWVDAFVRASHRIGQRYGVDSLVRWRHFLAAVSANTDGMRCDGLAGRLLPGMVENLTGYTPARLLAEHRATVARLQRDRSEFHNVSLPEIAMRLSSDVTMLADELYGHRRDLGNTENGDGAKYVGRGPMQVRGKAAYWRIAEDTSINLVSAPAKLEKPELAWHSAFYVWQRLGCNELADRGRIEAISVMITGSRARIAERREWLKRCELIWPAQDTRDDVAARDHATVADLAGSKKVRVLRRTQWAAVATSLTTTALAAWHELGLPETGDWINVEYLRTHAWVALAAGALLVAGIAAWLVRRHLADYRAGRYTPSGS